jgi:hypothetical protein
MHAASPWRRSRVVAAATGLGVVAALTAAGTAGSAAAGTSPGATVGARSAAVDCATVLAPGGGREADFAAAARAAGVPEAVLKAVSYTQTRWDDHGTAMSTSGGFGPLHLTDAPAELADGRGDGSVRAPLRSLQTAALAAELTGLSKDRLTSDAAANICGGAAVLAHLQREAGAPTGAGTSPASWAPAIAGYSGATDGATARRAVRQAFAVLRQGQARTTNDGERVRLAAHPRLRVPATAPASAASGGGQQVDCPRWLGCEWLPAPYEQYGPGTGDYGNHDLADRPRDLSIDYIVIHDTEATYETTLDLVTDPTYVSWQYSLRSVDGHIAQHLDLSDVGWHAGNWYVNAHSIGLEHEGFAAEGDWFTESMYRTSAALVRHLTQKYDIPRDRAHIIGHDQVPGTVPSTVQGMHWDPGPYWDWEHYMELLGAPIGGQGHRGHGGGHHGGGHHETRGGHGHGHGHGHGGKVRVGDVVTVKPGFDDNVQPLVGCETAGVDCEPHGTNFVYLHQAPDAESPLAWDEGLRPDATASTTQVSDIGARAAAGQELVVADREGDWLGVWWLGRLAWLESPQDDPTVVRSRGRTLKVVPRDGLESVPVYGRAYPEEEAYPEEIPYQEVTPLMYTIGEGQAYAVGDTRVSTDYYYAKSFDASVPGDRTTVEGDDRYYQVWLGHRLAYVRAADVRLTRR